MRTFKTTEKVYKQPLLKDTGIDSKTGRLISCPGVHSSFEPVFLRAGTTVSSRYIKGYLKMYPYGTEPLPCWSEKYCYAPEGNWLPYLAGLETEWTNIIDVRQDTYARFSLRNIPEKISLTEAVKIQLPQKKKAEECNWINDETDRLLGRIREAHLPTGVFYFILTDTHYAAGGNWRDTIASIRSVAERLKPKAIIHLGDLTDGMYPLSQTKHFAEQVLEDLRSVNTPLYLCLGNHDSNYFQGNPSWMTKRESALFYIGKSVPYYWVDDPTHKLRMFFLDSFDPTRKQRYGFSRRELIWLKIHASLTPKDWRLLVFSHVTPAAGLHVWSDKILNGAAAVNVLQHAKAMYLGWIHGHSHADQVFYSNSGPLIGIGCGKTECFTDHKPVGSITYQRKWNTPTQELWDVLFVPDCQPELRLFRYGAGEDRTVSWKGGSNWPKEI